MGTTTSPQRRVLAKKISRVELLILFALIMLWVLTYAWMSVKRSEHLETVFALQEQILFLAQDSLDPNANDLNKAWPFGQTFPLLVLKNQVIVNGTLTELSGSEQTIPEAFRNHINADVLFTEMSTSLSGSTWVMADRISDKKWVTWLHRPEKALTLVIVADEKPLLELSGFSGYSLLLIFCAVLGSALLLLALIWALSWMRLSAVKGLLKSTQT